MIELARLLPSGELAYISKHNTNYEVIEAALNNMQRAINGTMMGAITIPVTFEALFGKTVALIGSGSYVPSTSGLILTLSPGYAWIASTKTALGRDAETQISFEGIVGGTYYIRMDYLGMPSRDTVADDAFYEVVWDGAAFTSVTRLAPIVWGFDDIIAAQSSAALGQSYTTLDARLEAGESKASTGSSAATAVNGRLLKSVGGAADVTLTTTEAQNAMMEFFGALTGNISVKIPLASAPRLISVKNATTGDYTLAVKGTGGGSTGITIPQGYTTILYHDGTNVFVANSDAYVVSQAVPFSAAITLDWSLYDCAHITLAGNCTITHTNARKGQKCLLYLAQDATGGRQVTWGPEVAFGADIGGITLSFDPNKTDEIGFSHNWIAGKYNVVSIARGY